MGGSSCHPSSPGDQSEVIGMDYEWEDSVSYVTLSSSRVGEDTLGRFGELEDWGKDLGKTWWIRKTLKQTFLTSERTNHYCIWLNFTYTIHNLKRSHLALFRKIEIRLLYLRRSWIHMEKLMNYYIKLLNAFFVQWNWLVLFLHWNFLKTRLLYFWWSSYYYLNGKNNYMMHIFMQKL